MRPLSSDEIFQDYLLLHKNSKRKSRQTFVRELLAYLDSNNIKYKQQKNNTIELTEYQGHSVAERLNKHFQNNIQLLPSFLNYHTLFERTACSDGSISGRAIYFSKSQLLEDIRNRA